MKPPKAPPPPKIKEVTATVEAHRAEVFARWRPLLEREQGNITRAAVALLYGASGAGSPAEVRRARSYGWWLVQIFKMGPWAQQLREAAGVAPGGRGRPPARSKK